MADRQATETPRRRRTPSSPSPNGSSSARTVPHDDSAERHLLGAAMISPEALAIAAGVPAEDHYRPAHQHVAHVLAQAHAEGWPPDPVTVAAELKRAGILEEIGGEALLADLVATAPSTGAAPRYAEIIRGQAALRRLLGAGSEITELAYALASDPREAFTRARAILEAIPPAGAVVDALPMADVGAILDGNHEPDRPDLLVRSDGAGLLYTGRMNTLQGDPSCGKTWVALLAARQMLELGGSVLVLDYEDSPAATVARLLTLDTDRAAIRDRFRYLRPTEAIPNAHIVAAVQALNVDLVVIDSVAEALNTRGYSEDRSDEVLRWLDELPRAITRTGTTVLMLDHVVKSKEERGRWARGSGAKLGAQDGATYGVSSSGFNQRTEGRITLRVAKDRHGGIDAAAGETAASIRMVPHNGGQKITATIERPIPELEPPGPEQRAAARDRQDDERRAELAERVVAALDEATGPLSRRRLLAALRAGKDRLKFPDSLLEPVLLELEDDGAITTHPGRGGHPAYAPPPRQQALPDPAEEAS